MDSEDQQKNINLGLDRNTSESERQRYIDHVRAENQADRSYGASSSPGGLSILQNLFRRVEAPQGKRWTGKDWPTRLKQAVIFGIAGAIAGYAFQRPIFATALLGAIIGVAIREIFILVLVGLFLFIAYLWFGDHSTKPPAGSSEESNTSSANSDTDLPK